jgi:Holliday junction resolvase RusA-like endonuclease
MQATLTIILPLPPKELSPNFRSTSHWPKTNAVKKYRADCAIVARAAMQGLPKHWHHFRGGRAFPKFYTPTAHLRDPDNMTASLKAAWDGFVDAGLLVDDRYLKPAPADQEKDKRRPRVEVYMELEQ